MTSRIAEAVELAARLHDKPRKGTDIPYISHLFAVTALVLEHGGSGDEAIAAMLHDAAEDVGGQMLEQIRQSFGPMVAAIVEGCSDSLTLPKPPWRERKQRHIAHIRSASASVRLVAAADKLHNVRSILRDYRRDGERIWTRFKGGREGTLWYYRAFTEALRAAPRDPRASALLEQLENAVGELERVIGLVNAAAGPRRGPPGG